MAIKIEGPCSALFGPIVSSRQFGQTAPKVHNKHHKTAPADAVYIGRGSPWGNPYRIGDFWREKGRNMTRKDVIERYRINILPSLDLTPLRGKHLLCFCKPQACHGDLLLETAN